MFIKRDLSNPSSIFYLIWVVVLVATLGSLFFSEVMKLPPCVLCWYQRVAMYPLVVLIPVALIASEIRLIRKYVLILATIGFLVAAYHNLLYYGLIPESIAPCKEGVSCTSKQIEWFGFVTIPFLSLAGFSLIITLSGISYLRGNRL